MGMRGPRPAMLWPCPQGAELRWGNGARPAGGFLGSRGAPAPDRRLRGGQGLIPSSFPRQALRALWLQ